MIFCQKFAQAAKTFKLPVNTGETIRERMARGEQ